MPEASGAIDAVETILGDGGDLNHRGRTGGQSGLLDDEQTIRGDGITATGQIPDDPASDDEAPRDDPDEGAIRPLPTPEFREDRLALIVCHRSIFLISDSGDRTDPSAQSGWIPTRRLFSGCGEAGQAGLPTEVASP